MACFVFERYTGRGGSAFAHVASTGRTWAKRDILEAAHDYAFHILGVRRLYSILPAEGAEPGMRFDRKIGMRPEAVLPDFYPHCDGVMLCGTLESMEYIRPAETTIFRLDVVLPDGTSDDPLIYDQRRGLLFDSWGNRLTPSRSQRGVYLDAFKPAHAVSPETPGRKQAKVERLKIQLGLGCNYKCSYCMQVAHRYDAAPTKTRDVEELVEMLRQHLEPRVQKIELWGGEPLLYWAKIKRLVPMLRELYPEARIGMVTNGSLLVPTMAQFICEHDMSVSVSHDGPAYDRTRGPDPLDNPTVVESLRILHEDGRLQFISVLTEEMTSVEEVAKHIEGKAGFRPRVGKEGVVRSYNREPPLSEEARQRLFTDTLVDGLSGALDDVFVVQNRLENFYNSIEWGTPRESFGQSCAMDREDWLAVDLKGNVLTCQNVGAESHHKIGHISDLSNVRLDTSYHWSHRPECATCPVLVLCRGSCMYIDEESFAATCANEYAYNRALLSLAVHGMTGRVVSRIERIA